jgi:hypothetical protein
MIYINHKYKLLVDSETGNLLAPECWDNLIPYVSCIEARSHPAYAQSILKQVFNGELVITKLIENAQKRGLEWKL